MDFTLGLEDLPVEVIEYIANYLPTSDLNNCCSVCVSWHDIFGQDLFWRRHCNLNIIKHIKSKKSQLDGAGCLSDEDPCLKNVDKLRLAYIYQNHLRSNWVFGRYSTQEISIQNTDDFISADFLENDFILVNKNMFTEVWMITETPVLVSTIPYNFPEVKKPDFIKIVNDMLVVIQHNLVKVFKSDGEKNYWSLTFSFLFDKSEEFSSRENDDSCFNGLVSTDILHIDTVFLIHGDILIGIAKREPVLHLWDIKKKKKIKAQNMPPIDGSFLYATLVESQPPSNMIHVQCGPKTVKLNARLISYFYSISKLEFLPFNVKHDGLAVLSHDCFYILEGQFLIIYNNKTGNKMIKVIVQLVDHHFLRVYDQKVVILCGNKIHVFDPVRNENRMAIQVPFSINNWKHIWDKFVITENYYRDNIIWLTGKGPKRILSYTGIFLSVNKSCTKLLIKNNNKLVIKNFW